MKFPDNFQLKEEKDGYKIFILPFQAGKMKQVNPMFPIRVLMQGEFQMTVAEKDNKYWAALSDDEEYSNSEELTLEELNDKLGQFDSKMRG